MSELDKMLRGEQYDAGDAALVEGRLRARRLIVQLDALDPGDTAARQRLFGELLGDMGDGVSVELPFRCDYGSHIHLGARVYINMGCVFLDSARIVIGDDVQIGPLVQLLTPDHPRNALLRAEGLESARPITIGARSWLGGGVIVLPGIEIGSEVIVGAGSVVTRSLPSGVTAAGNPCRVIST